MTFADIFCLKVQTERAKVGCLREFQNSISDSVYSLLEHQIEKFKLKGFKLNKTSIDYKHKGGFRFRGLARSIEAIKSMFGFKYFWLEEGQFISEDSLKILTPTLREIDSELWISANPMNSADPFSQRFITPYIREIEKNGFYEDDLHYIVKVNYKDNPWFPDSLEQERAHDELHLSRAMYDHVWEGAFNDSVEDSIIMAEWFDAAIDSHRKLGFKPLGAVIVSHDPSDLGTDNKGLVIRQGSVILEAKDRTFGDVNSGCDWALETAVDSGCDLFVWDCDGLGLSLKRQVSEFFKGKKIDFKMFQGSRTPEYPFEIYEPLEHERKKEKSNKEAFLNRRAQYYWYLRDRFYKTWLAVEKGYYINPEELISISSDISDMNLFRSEVCRIPRKYNSSGRIQIMSKKEMKRLKIASPNISDSAMMSLVRPEDLGSDERIIFDTVH